MYGFNLTLFIASIFWIRSQNKEDTVDMSFKTIALPFAVLFVLSLFLSSVKLGADGSVDVVARFTAHVVVDVLGYYLPVSGSVSEGRYVTLPAPQRCDRTNPR